MFGPEKSEMVCAGSVVVKRRWICVENHILSRKLEKEDYDV